MITAVYGSITVCELLLQHNASVDLTDHNGKSVLLLADEHGHSQIADLLLQYTNVGAEALCDNIQAKLMNMEQETLTYIIESGYKLWLHCADFNGMPYIHYLMDKGNIELTKFILEKGLHPNVLDKDGCTPLFNACIRDDVKGVSLLLDHSAEVDVTAHDGSTPISICNDKGHIVIMKLLVRHSKQTNLLTAATCGNVPMLKALVDQGVRVNQKFATGQTALHEASFHGHVECINILRESGAKTHIKDLWGNTPLHMAAQSGSFDALKKVLQMDFSLINIQNTSNGWTAIHMAIRENPTSKTVTELKKAQASQVVPDHDGHTADYYSNFGKRLYHKDEHPRRDMLGNMRYIA